MVKTLKRIALVLPVLLLALPAYAAFNEHELGETLRSLRTELRKDYQKRTAAEKSFSDLYRNQRRQMVATMKKSNELSLLLYSQKQDYTFDLTYALGTVTSEYNKYNSNRLPYDRIVTRLDWDIDRYARLLEALRRIPPEINKLKIIPDSLAYHNDSLDRMRPMFPTIKSKKELDRLRKAIAERMATDSLSRSRPFLLSEEEETDRDSCIFYAAELLKLSAGNKTRVVTDSTHYQRAYLHLKESYDYAMDRSKQLQERIFVQGQTPYSSIFKGFGRHWSRAAKEMGERYNFSHAVGAGISNVSFNSPARCPILVGFLIVEIVGLLLLILITSILFKLAVHIFKGLKQSVSREQHFSFIVLISVIINGIILIILNNKEESFLTSAASLMGTYLWLLGATVAALMIRLDAKSLRGGIKLYLPLMITALVVIGLRIVFMPNQTLNVVFTPLLLIFFIWQFAVCLKYGTKASGYDRTLGWLTLLALGAATAVSFFGYIFVALIIMVWWFFQIATILTLVTISHLLEQFRNKQLKDIIDEYKKRLTFVSAAERDNLLFGATWAYDFVKTVVVPVLAILSIPFCIKLALGVFDFTEIFDSIYSSNFINLTNDDGAPAFRMSFQSIVLLTCLYFVFRYVNYAAYSLFQNFRYAAQLKRTGRKTVRKDEINFSLGKSVISILVWFTFIIVVIVTLKVPTNSLTIIAGGLSAGIGIALKDVLNNFIYGIQLMSGRVRVGDWIECDGVRGRVTNISYQSTQIETLENAEMSFLNATLFNKNFSNLTHNNSYEFIKIIVGVSYGTEVEKVREVLVEALQELRTKDNYGREVVDPKRGIYVAFDGFGDSSVNLAVKQYVLVAERIAYVDKAKEIIYDALNKAGITIPFPQRDIHVIGE
ncbi:MAG: mechanosensitive ion channel [Bacteroidales bacterium]|nr:mechanosensitive ion channel [Bacteroidales bacterium]